MSLEARISYCQRVFVSLMTVFCVIGGPAFLVSGCLCVIEGRAWCLGVFVSLKAVLGVWVSLCHRRPLLVTGCRCVIDTHSWCLVDSVSLKAVLRACVSLRNRRCSEKRELTAALPSVVL